MRTFLQIKSLRFGMTLVVVASLVSGCATQGVSTAEYSPPIEQVVQNEKTVDRAQPVVWDELVRELSKSFFVINNIERESRIINVSFQSSTPGDYVDCGRTRRTYAEGDKRELFDYAVADSSTYKEAGRTQPHPAQKTYARVNRQTSLEGRSNIYVAPDSSNSSRTVVSVNTRYVLSIKVHGEGILEHANGNVLHRSPFSRDSNPMVFNTNKPTSQAAGGITIVCRDKGRLESEILRMVR